jgi:transcriptional regulator with XRE-family HTH domain
MRPLTEFLKDERERRGLSQGEVSALMGIGGAYQKLENGTTPLRPWQLILFCQSLDGLDVSVALKECSDPRVFSEDKLREVMKKGGFTPRTLAARLGTKPVVVKYYLRGAVPSDERRGEMEDILGVRSGGLLDKFLAQVRKLLADGIDVRKFARPRKSATRSTSKAKVFPRQARSSVSESPASLTTPPRESEAKMVCILCTAASYEKIKDILGILDSGHVVRRL